MVFVNTQVAEAIYSSYPLMAFMPFFPGADADTHLLIHDVFNNSEQSMPFKSMLEVRRFHPASSLVVIMKVGVKKSGKFTMNLWHSKINWTSVDNPERAYAVDYAQLG